ncbi:hypothetical protein [Streptomyces sp. FIT100]|uniref:hypothetical protein n=1 Tax=Streptomyces sp. FIT100 TaxID=2837956 RepID=UPI0021C5E65D|nr:hypothetical protein [Streptomyces sp. FIT100]UUN28591.1 hypothetical protein KK483_21070 [Streptomyces sp. FIT100]
MTDISTSTPPAIQRRQSPRRPASRPLRFTSPAGWTTAITTAALLIYTTLTAGVFLDIRYVLAAMRTTGEGGISPSEIFAHRPLFYRWVLAALDFVTGGATGSAPIAVSEGLMRLVGIVLAAAAGLLLHRALRRRMPERDAALTAGLAALTLAFAPVIDYLQPEWFAIVLAMGALAAALGIRSRWQAAALASLPLGLAVLMKYSTAGTAAMALLIVFAVDRVRALLLAAATAVATGLLFAFSAWAGSRELQWLRDMPYINAHAFGSEPVVASDLLQRTADYLGDRITVTPVLALLPGALLLFATTLSSRRRRIEATLVTVLLVAGGLSVVVYQGNWFAYHGENLPVVAAALTGLAIGRWYGRHGRPPLCLTVLAFLLGVLTPLLAFVRTDVDTAVLAWLASAASLVAALVDVLRARARVSRVAPRPRRRGAPVALTTLALAVCLAATVWPTSGVRVILGTVVTTNAELKQQSQSAEAAAEQVRAELPDGAEVLYLSFGQQAYYIGHPTACRYPFPTFLNVPKQLTKAASLTSTRENVRCVTQEHPAAYAVYHPSWMSLGVINPRIAAAIRNTYECPKPTQGQQLVVCPLRHPH